MNREKFKRVRMIKTSDMEYLDNAAEFLESKGIDTENYRIVDASENGYRAQIPIALWLTEFAEQQASNPQHKPRAKKKALRLFGVVRWFSDRKRKILFGTAAVLLFAFSFGNDMGWYDDAACFLGGLAIGYS